MENLTFSFPTNTMKVRLVFTDDLLATNPDDKNIFDSFVASKRIEADAKAGKKTNMAEIEDESDTIPDIEPEGRKIFKQFDDGSVAISAYMLKGFFKSAGTAWKQVEPSSKSWSAIKSKVDRYITVKSTVSRINKYGMEIFDLAPIMAPDGSRMTNVDHLERPLRCSGPAGERTALTSSEFVPAGCYVEFEISYSGAIDATMIKKMLSYGINNGLGEWRSSGKGSFKTLIISENATVAAPEEVAEEETAEPEPAMPETKKRGRPKKS